MFRLICLGAVVVLLYGCSSEDTPTRHNDFTPLTSIEIVAVAPAIAANTSTRLAVIGNFSGQYTRDVTDQAVWKSNSPTVADFVTPTPTSRVTGLTPGTALLTATVGNVSTTFTLTVTSATVTAMAITPAAPTVPAGLSAQFAASGNFTDGTIQDLTFDASWASSTPAVATISNTAGSNGLAQALAAGTSTVTATFEGVSATALMTVTEVVLQSITVTPANPSILSLSTGSFTATGHYSDGSTADVTTQAAWSSSQPGFATIAAGGAATTLAPGTTTISATLKGVSGTSSLKVTGGSLTGIVLSPVNPRVVKGTAVPMTATGSFNNGSTRDITGAVGWSVTSPTVANVTTPGGNVAFLNGIAVSLAPTALTATSGPVTATTSLTVAAPALQSIAISPSDLNLSVHTSGRFTATAAFNDATTQDVTVSTTWTSSNSGIASVDNTGLAKGRVHGISAGPVTITATFGGLTTTSAVTVNPARTVATLTVSNFPAFVLVSGNQVPFTATATFTDATTPRDVTEDASWSIDNTNVATFADSQNQPGRVVGVDSGSTTLRVGFGGKIQTVILTVP